MDFLKSPLYSKYVESNAKLVDFAGWEMPISFSGLIKEHESVDLQQDCLIFLTWV